MMKSLPAAVILLFLLPFVTTAQNEPIDGLRSNIPSIHAFTNARIVVSPDQTIEPGTLLIQDGIIRAVGEDVRVPQRARIWDMHGMTLYPGFIDLSTSYGMPDAPSDPKDQAKPQSGVHDWNVMVRSHLDAAELFSRNEKAAKELRSQGFVVTLSYPRGGIFSGAAACVSLGEGSNRDLVKRDNVAQYISLRRSGSFLSPYPNSLMGIVALIRQTLLDADWYSRVHTMVDDDPSLAPAPPVNHSLGALADVVRGNQPVVIHALDEYDVLRASKIIKEFNLKGWVDGSGLEFRRLAAIKAANLPITVPVKFPPRPSVTSPEKALEVSLEELREWDAGPENPARLDRAGVRIALTTRDLKKPASFLNQVREAVHRGLSPRSALRALTVTPAQLLGLTKTHGTLDPGKAASFFVASGDVFATEAEIRDVWIDGVRYVVKDVPAVDVRGTWTTSLSGAQALLSFKGKPAGLKGSLTLDTAKRPLANIDYHAGSITFTTEVVTSDSAKTMLLFSANVSHDVLSGMWYTTAPDSHRTAASVWKAARKTTFTDSTTTADNLPSSMASYPDVYPLGAFGRPTIPDQPPTVIFRNATVWTMGEQGRLVNTDVLVKRGKIAAVGRNLDAPSGTLSIDASGLHITPGLIDAHSHTGISRGINEGGQAITCEVRIEDVLDPDNIWIYRQLAGGTIGANVLHGSANPIGGQNAVVKWRWGSLPDELLIRGAPKGVKFALGENVKRSNFRVPGRPVRYPASRMGVEQIIRDRFNAAREYEQSWKTWENEGEGLPPRRDLELEAIVEILHGDRFIHAHAYRQDEILMLMRVAEDFGIRIRTFQHVLEGYKVADIMAKHGAGGSGFSDWWAYKWEAYDAIPGNIPLMHDQGVLVSYNSDNSQLATRLNWEAAKGLRFGMTEEEALATVTINPAKQLGIDGLMGSLEPGKDADIAVWSGNPLSTRTKCLQTWVDGRRYFDIGEDAAMREEIARERAVLIQKVLQENSSPSAAGPQRMIRRPNEDIIESCMEGSDHE